MPKIEYPRRDSVVDNESESNENVMDSSDSDHCSEHFVEQEENDSEHSV